MFFFVIHEKPFVPVIRTRVAFGQELLWFQMTPARSITLLIIAPKAIGQLYGRSVETQKFLCPPGVVSVSVFRVSKPVVIDHSLKVFWRAIRKRVISQQCYHYRRTLQKSAINGISQGFLSWFLRAANHIFQSSRGWCGVVNPGFSPHHQASIWIHMGTNFLDRHFPE